MPPLRIGFVPEHFSTPLHFARKYFNLTSELIPFPSGTGHMVTALRSREIDIGIGLTEGWIAGLGRKKDAATGEVKKEGGYKLLGTYVESPLCWAISTGINREDLKGVQDLKGGKMGVSRFGSGSHIMGCVLADQHGWTSSPFTIHPHQNFLNLRSSVSSPTPSTDFFMWEYFTSKRYYSTSASPYPIKQLGEIYTPWPSWLIAGSPEPSDSRVGQLFEALDKGIEYFSENQEEAVQYISTELDYTEEDARKWLRTVRFAEGTRGVENSVVEKTVEVLLEAGVLLGEEDGGAGMISLKRW